MKRFQRNMIDGPLLPNVLMYTIPIILTSVLQLLFNAADLVVVGQFCGKTSVAAVGATSAITNLIINVFIGLSVGTGVSVAHAVGSKNGEETHRAVHTAIPAALIGGVILTVVGVCGAKTFLTWMDTPDTVLDLAALYMQIYFAGITFNLVYNFCASILRAAGDTKSPLIFLALAGVINVILNLIFVTQFHMNVAGVALATIISQAVSAVLVVWALMCRKDACRLHLGKLRFYREQLIKMIRIGLPAGIQGSLFSISNVMIQSSINSFGEVVMSGNTAAATIEGFVYVTLNAFHQTALNFTGQNAGAGRFDRVKKTLLVCLGCVTVASISAGWLAYGLGPMLLPLYITDSAEAIGYGLTRLAYICIPYFLCGLMDVSTGALRGMGASLQPMILSVLGVCGIRILWIYLIFPLPQFHTPECLYLSYTVSWTVTFVMQMIAYLIIYRQKSRQFLPNAGGKT